jgi:hypothetical protein
MVTEILGSIFMIIHCTNFLCGVVDTFMNIFVFLKSKETHNYSYEDVFPKYCCCYTLGATLCPSLDFHFLGYETLQLPAFQRKLLA